MSNAAPDAASSPFTVIDETTGLDVRLNHLPHLTITSEDGTVTRYIEVGRHLTLMDERDEYRRVCALVNAWRRTQGTNLRHAGLSGAERELAQLLARVGEDDQSGDAMRSLVAAFRDGQFRSPATSDDPATDGQA
jgi:hypothetical protein